MFNFADFIIKGLIKSFEEGSLGEGQVYMSASDWFERKRIDDNDMERLMIAIEEIKAERNRLKEQREQEELDEEVFPEEDLLLDEEPVEDEE